MNGSTRTASTRGLLQQFQLLRQRRKQLGRDVGTQNAQRVRLEGHDHRLAAEGVGALRHAPHDLLVRDVHAIKIAPRSPPWGQVLTGTSSSLRNTCMRGVVLEIELEFQAVVGQANVGRQRGVGCLVRQVVRDMGEERALRLATAPPCFSEFSTVECVGCGWCRNASRNRISRPCSLAMRLLGHRC